MVVANVFWLICQIFSSPKDLTAAGQDRLKKRSKSTSSPSAWEGVSLSCSPVTLWVGTNPGPSSSHRKSFSSHHMQGLDLDHLHNAETCLLSWSLLWLWLLDPCLLSLLVSPTLQVLKAYKPSSSQARSSFLLSYWDKVSVQVSFLLPTSPPSLSGHHFP